VERRHVRPPRRRTARRSTGKAHPQLRLTRRERPAWNQDEERGRGSRGPILPWGGTLAYSRRPLRCDSSTSGGEGPRTGPQHPQEALLEATYPPHTLACLDPTYCGNGSGYRNLHLVHLRQAIDRTLSHRWSIT
jgi:hypothetical protein